jgi:hypothetical protein
MKKVLQDSILVSFVFLICQLFYNIEIVRSNVEDIAFDAINKYIIKENQVNVNAPNIFVLAIDDTYMVANKLFDKNRKPNYGYLFPRDKLASIIVKVDNLCDNIDKENIPKTLFLDYDMEFTSMPNGKILSKEDKKLLEILKEPRSYTIVLPKSNAYNFIQYSQDSTIQKLIRNKKIVFASVKFLKTSDGIVRRYSAYKSFKEFNGQVVSYPNVDVLLWYMIRHGSIPTIKDINSTFFQDDIIANRIKIKAYKDSKDESSVIQYSYWNNLVKLSAKKNLFEIDEDDYKNSIIMVGGTYHGNSDRFDVLDLLTKEKISGVDLHANILLTLLSFNEQVQTLPLYYGLATVFITFFLISLLISKILLVLKLYNTNYEFIVVLFVQIVILISISTYLLIYYNLWFNWFTPLIVFKIVEVIDLFKDYGPKVISKMMGDRK